MKDKRAILLIRWCNRNRLRSANEYRIARWGGLGLYLVLKMMDENALRLDTNRGIV